MTESVTTQLLHRDRRGNALGDIHTPVHTSVQYAFDSAESLIAAFAISEHRSAVYARSGTPTVFSLEDKVTMLEDGIGTVCFASGMAALTGTFLALLNAGDHLVASCHLFGNTASLLKSLARLGIVVDLVDPSQAHDIEVAIRPTTRMVFVESVSNPTTVVSDLARIGAVCEQRSIPFVVDNTILSPLLYKARGSKASLVVNSLTKTLAGHGSGLGGGVTDTGVFDWSRYPNIADAYKSISPAYWALTQIRKRGLRDMGGALSSEHAHSIMLGMETASLRVAQTCSSALQLARFLESHPTVCKVNYPFLDSHPQVHLARELFLGGSWLLSFSMQTGAEARALLNALAIPAKSTGLGCGRSLVIPVAETLYSDMAAEMRHRIGVDDGLVRYSVGLEPAADLIGDLAQALSRVSAA